MKDGGELWQRLRAGERRALAKLLSLAESAKPDDERQLSEALTAMGSRTRALRLGVTGIPGAGKSTLIDVLGAHFIGQGRRVAVLAVDPSSPFSGGSVMGDKLRMPRLSASPSAFVRPLANRGHSGGGVYALDECLQLCELSGYDVVIVETVGVGQSEIDAALVCDVTLLVVVPGTGDEIQALKRGVTEVVDAVVVNKADLVDVNELEQVERAYVDGVSYFKRPHVRVASCSAKSGQGVEALASLVASLAVRGQSEQVRTEKRQLLLKRTVERALLRHFENRVLHSPEFAATDLELSQGRIGLSGAIARLLALTGSGLVRPECPRDPSSAPGRS